MQLANRQYPHVIVYAEYDDLLNVYEKIILHEHHTELVLRKPNNLTYLKVSNSKDIVEEKDHIYLVFNKESKEIELQYTINLNNPVAIEWVMAPKNCFTLDATIRTPLPFKSIINAPIYGFHAWGKYGYSRWVNLIPRRKYIVTIDEYYILDNNVYIISSPNELFLDNITMVVNDIYLKTKDIISWNKPIIVYNNKVAEEFVSTNIIFVKRDLQSNILGLLVKSLVNELEDFPGVNKLIEAISVIIDSKKQYCKDNGNPYIGLTRFYGKDILRKLLETSITSCCSTLKQLINSMFEEPLTDTILLLLQRREHHVETLGDKIRCTKGPCILVLERNGMEFLKTILLEGEELKLDTNILGNTRIIVF